MKKFILGATVGVAMAIVATKYGKNILDGVKNKFSKKETPADPEAAAETAAEEVFEEVK